MDQVLNSNIFFFVTATAVIIITAVLVVALYYVIIILRDVRYVADEVRKTTEDGKRVKSMIMPFLRVFGVSLFKGRVTRSKKQKE